MRSVLSVVRNRLRERANQDLTTYRELQAKLAGVPRYRPGFVTAGNWQLHYPDAASLLSAFDVVVEHHFDESRLLREYWLESAEKMGRSDAYWTHHWEHDDIEKPELQLAGAEQRLSEWRREHVDECRVSEGMCEDELALVRDVSFYQQYLIERTRPRNYDQFGLVKR